jgi:hypothetical protein
VMVGVSRGAVVVILPRARNCPHYTPVLSSGLPTPCIDVQHLQDLFQVHYYVFVVEWGCFTVDLDCKCLFFIEKCAQVCVWAGSQKVPFFSISHSRGHF